MDSTRQLTDDKLLKMEKDLTDLYKQTEKELTEKWQSFMKKSNAKLGQKRSLLEQMQNDPTANVDDIARVTGDIEKIERMQMYQSTRFTDLMDDTANRLADVNQTAVNYINGKLPEIYADNYNAMSAQADDIGISFDLVDEGTVKVLATEDKIRLPYKKIDRAKDISWNAKKINSSVLQGILQGESMDKIAKRIQPITGSNWSAAIRNARTMVTGAENAGRLDSFKTLEEEGIIVEKMWMATADDRTRESHALLDGESIPMKDHFSNGLEYPGDPNGPPEEVYNCRCTMVADIKGFRREDGSILGVDIERYDRAAYNYYNQYRTPTVVNSFQSQLGRATTVNEVNDLMNSQGWFRTYSGTTSQADLTGCDLDSAKSIAATYHQTFEKFPQLKGKINAPDAQPRGMGKNTYAWCYSRSGGKVQVNPNMYNNWQNVVKSYERDVLSGWHPKGTTAESIVAHELGHSIDGLLAQKGILGGYTKNGEFRYASSSMRTTVMNRAAKSDSYIESLYNYYGSKQGSYHATLDGLSRYATKNPQEWFAECYAEYITSANPRVIATEFGKELERLLEKME